MEFGLLGLLVVGDAGRPVRVAGGRERALLAVLLLHANRPVAAEALLEWVWGERPPAGGRKGLQIYVSRLRKLVGAERIATTAAGYRLRVEPGELDLEEFGRLSAVGREALERGDPVSAEALLGEALGLWRGEALADFRFEPFAQDEIRRLDERRAAVAADLVDARLALGHDGGLLAEIEQLVAANPTWERPRAQLMLALYRQGRHADALAVYQEARGMLVDELGLEPSRQLRQLEQAILRQDPALDPASPTGRSILPDDFVGRTAELDALRAGLGDAMAGRGRLVLIAGEPGIGKSRLAEAIAAQARDRGATVLTGRCWEAGGAPPFWPWVQALQPYIREQEPDTLRQQLGLGAADLAQILPELDALYDDLPAPPSTDPEGARFRLFEAIASFLRRASIARPLMLILDDLHAADTPSLLLLRFLARSLAGSRLLVVAAYRNVDPALGDPLAATVAELLREPVTRQLQIEGLDEEEVATLVASTADFDPSTGVAAAIYRKTEGNPFFVGELVRLLAAEGALEDAAATSAWNGVVPEGVKAVILRRLERLSEGCTETLNIASVLGREFDLEALAHSSGLSRDAVLDSLDEAAAERVVADVPGVVGRLRFEHALIRDTLYEELPSGRRAQLERRVGEALEKFYGPANDAYLAELAHHFLAAVPAAEKAKAIDYARLAGDRAAQLTAFEEAARLYATALTLVADDVARCDLLLALGEAEARAGDTPASKETFDEAAEIAASLGLFSHLARAALGYGGRIPWDASRSDPHLAPLLEAALEALGEAPTTMRVQLLARLSAGPLRAAADRERRRALATQAVELARRLEDPPTLGYALLGYISSRHAPDFTHEQVAVAKELVQLSLETGDLERAIDGYESTFEASTELGDHVTADSALEAMDALAEQLRQPSQRWIVRVHRALLALLQGRFDAAELLIEEAHAIGSTAQGWTAEASRGLQLYLLRREQRRLGEVEQLVLRAADENPTYPIWLCARANMFGELSKTDAARAELDRLAPDDFSAVPFDEEWTVSLSFLSETIALIGESEHAPTLYNLLLPYADRFTISYSEISLGPIARILGLLSTATGQWSDADRHFADAIECCDRVGARPWLAHAKEDYATMLLRRRQPGDSSRANALIDEAAAIYRECGLAARAENALAG